MNRREFLQSTAATVAAASMVQGISAGAQGAVQAEAWPENGTLIPDEGWRLWVDERAEWKQDAIFLPEDVTQDADGVVRGKGEPLPGNAPTGGWGVLAGQPAGSIPVALPGTVEQHFWGKFGAGADGKPRLYTPDEYRYAADVFNLTGIPKQLGSADQGRVRQTSREFAAKLIEKNTRIALHNNDRRGARA